MSDYIPDHSFTLDDIIREFGSDNAPAQLKSESLPEPAPESESSTQPEPKKKEKKRAVKVKEKPVKKAREQTPKKEGQQQKTLAFRLCVCFVASVVSTLLALYHGFELHWISGLENLPAISLISLVLLLAAIVSAYDVLAMGISQVKARQFGPQTLLVVLSVASVMEALVSVFAARVPFCFFVSLALLCALFAQQRQVQAAAQGTELVQDFEGAVGIQRVPKMWHGASAAVCAEAEPVELEEVFGRADPEQAVMRVYVPLALVLSLVLGVIGALMFHVNFVWLWTALLLAATPFGVCLSYILPYSLLASHLARKDAVLLGWRGAQTLRECDALFLSDSDLFPEDCLRLGGVKVFNGYDNTRVMQYAGAVLHAVGSELASKLTQGSLSKIENFRSYNEGGYSAEIGTDTVMVGTLEFSKRIGVHLDKGAKVRQALYVSINGELAGVLALHYETSSSVKRALKHLSDAPAPIPVLTGVDPLISPEMLRKQFGLPLSQLANPSLRSRVELRDCKGGAQGARMARAQLEGMCDVCIGAKALVSAVYAALALNVLSGAVGMLCVFWLTALGVFETLSCVYALLFVLIWALAFSASALSVRR